MLPLEIRDAILDQLRAEHGTATEWEGADRIGGGSINHTWRIRTTAGHFFLKHNSAYAYPGMFEAEARGLQRLRETSTLRIPEVLMTGEAGEYSFLMLENMTEEYAGQEFFANFGRDLGKLHQTSWKAFGLDHSNYIGSIRQSNAPRGQWVPFFIEERIQPLVKDAIDSGRIQTRTLSSFERLYRRIPDLIPDEPPALLHGDLWYGNFIRLGNGQAVLIDPAIYFGHREVDLAMTRLFGGFAPEFYAAYAEVNPLAPDWEKRVDLWNLYPLLVHVKLFGQEYVPRLLENLAKFI